MNGDFGKLRPFLMFSSRHKLLRSITRFCYLSSFFIFEDGAAGVEVGNEIYEIEPGSVLYIPAGLKHTFCLPERNPAVFRTIYFDWSQVERPEFSRRTEYFHIEEAGFSRPVRREYIGIEPPFFLNNHTLTESVGVWLQLVDPFVTFDILEQKEDVGTLKAQGHFLLFLEKFIGFASADRAASDPRILSIIHELDQQDVGEPSFPSRWIVESGLSKSQFYMLFKAHTGFSPQAYWNRLRLEKIKTDLRQSMLSIGEIAARYNYSSAYYFSSQFRRLAGMTPSRYRRESTMI
jgi:AraC-like DNA-binding protein